MYFLESLVTTSGCLGFGDDIENPKVKSSDKKYYKQHHATTFH